MNRVEREFLDSLIAKRYSEHTLSSYQSDLDFFFDYLNQEGVLMDKVDRLIIRDFESSQLEKGVGARSLQRRMSACRQFYAFMQRKGYILNNPFRMAKAPKKPHKTLFIDDLCVDEKARGQKLGEQFYQFALAFAKEQGCYNITLDVWEGNDGAKRKECVL